MSRTLALAPGGTRLRALIIAAQDEEIVPVLAALRAEPFCATTPATAESLQSIFPTELRGASGVNVPTNLGPVLCLRTGIGLVATASALGWALARYRPEVIISAGSAGGLAADIRVGDVVAGTRYRYGRADATVFGYAPGQVPGAPEYFEGDATLLAAVPENARRGEVLSSDAFVTAANVEDTRTRFPDALLTDMESTAAAHTAALAGIPFITIRSASDLCGPQAGIDYHIGIDEAADLSARAVTATLARLAETSPWHGTASGSRARSLPPRFSHLALEAAILYVFGRVHATAGDDAAAPAASLDAEMVADVRKALGDCALDADEVLACIARAQRAIAADPQLTLTAKQYDAERLAVTEQAGAESGRGKLTWPPTSQTVIKRFSGYWNEALQAVGLSVSSGRKRGALKFTTQDYVDALRSHAIAARRNGKNVSYNGYVEWLADSGNQGTYPSGAAIRQRFGSWSAALAEAGIS
ncbi:5'-methylthioadenosine/S-adenosylhomocysteine nucleosidase [Actinotignum sanguinis]|uniref:5'-methylthioadenosine/S-adenosylhomocysteine nucleosidase n=1 Tax=Actinotignum sanguinis TaxID=1445614 RepID=UPI000F7E32FE|nr:5'-methylthioadenosine/S-adenosylhomocysteine nucleosidase [Actinotignum sanguinis]MDY5148072.1 5'-methylthioadenosine/S-adenosylhomocysteine nucleosidase [Actinotignum sanguinis]RTE47618.1 5'-methylthioadenosine/S-adenosylhomocysteine nucleosidase [Actinotignum sanguinis]